jgi:flavin-dependent dehydrogenase
VDSQPDQFDIVIIGGAFSGAATALLLRRKAPQLRVLIIEKLTAFDQKVGEATTEMSAMFLTRELALWKHLEDHHLPKEGLRSWSTNSKVTGHGNASDTGGFLRSTVPSFQLRRDVLDEHILSLAVDEGATLLRPARVKDVTLKDFDNTVTLTQNINGVEQTREIKCRWVLDASGRQCFLGKRLGLIDWNEEHPIAAIWARFDNVRHIDDLAARAGKLGGGNVGSRRLGTNHYIGRGFWIWVIPLGNGQTSIGVVFDKRFHQLHEAKDRRSAFEGFLKQHAPLAELIEGATLDPEDLRGLSRVAYATRQYMGNGWALLGDAAVFLDPYYSPGLDHAAFCAHATAEAVMLDFAGEKEKFAKEQMRHNARFLRSYRWFFRCVYRDKYFLMGEHDLTSASFLIDTTAYYTFLVLPAYRFAKRFVNDPVLAPRGALPIYTLLRFMKWRFKRIAALRLAAGEAGARNNNRRIRAFYNLNLAPAHMFLRGVKLWVYAEIDAVRLRIKTLFRRRPDDVGTSAATKTVIEAQPAAILAGSPRALEMSK